MDDFNFGYFHRPFDRSTARPPPFYLLWPPTRTGAQDLGRGIQYSLRMARYCIFSRTLRFQTTMTLSCRAHIVLDVTTHGKMKSYFYFQKVSNKNNLGKFSKQRKDFH